MKTLARTLALLLVAAMPAQARAADPVATTLTVPEPITAEHATAPVIEVFLASGEVPVEGREVTYLVRPADPDVTIEADPVATVTDAAGTAAAPIPLDVPLGEHEIVVSFAGDDEFLPAEGVVPVTVTRAASKMTFTGTSTGVRGVTITLRVRLQHATTNANLAGRPVTFSIPDQLDATATTNATGEASVGFKLDALYGSYPLTVTYGGEELYGGSTLARNVSITWSWAFASAGGLGTVYLNDILDEYRVSVPGADSGIVTGADISKPVPNLAAAQIVVASRAGQDASIELVGDARFGALEAAGHFGSTPFALANPGVV